MNSNNFIEDKGKMENDESDEIDASMTSQGEWRPNFLKTKNEKESANLKQAEGSTMKENPISDFPRRPITTFNGEEKSETMMDNHSGKRFRYDLLDRAPFLFWAEKMKKTLWRSDPNLCDDFNLKKIFHHNRLLSGGLALSTKLESIWSTLPIAERKLWVDLERERNPSGWESSHSSSQEEDISHEHADDTASSSASNASNVENKRQPPRNAMGSRVLFSTSRVYNPFGTVPVVKTIGGIYAVTPQEGTPSRPLYGPRFGN